MEQHHDTHDAHYTPARMAMVRDQLEGRDIIDTCVLHAMCDVPRHLFVPLEWREAAYDDRPLPIGENQTISQPYIVALMLQLLALQGYERVLEIGSGSGYQTALLSHLASHIYSIEYFPALTASARARVQHLGLTNVDIRCGDGGRGLPQYAPYDAIIVAAAASRVPPALMAQLAAVGRLVLPIGPSDYQDLLLVRKDLNGIHLERSVPCRFVPLLGQEGQHTDL